MADAPIETLSRDAFDAEVREHGTITLFRYTPNSRGFTFLQICAAILLGIAFLTYADTHFEPLYWGIFAGGLTLFAMGLLAIVIYWSVFARWNAVAFDDDHLYIVGRKEASRIDWRAVSLETAGLKDSDLDQHPGVFHMRIGTHKLRLRLFNPYVWIDDFPSLLAELLSQIKINLAAAADEEDATASD